MVNSANRVLPSPQPDVQHHGTGLRFGRVQRWRPERRFTALRLAGLGAVALLLLGSCMTGASWDNRSWIGERNPALGPAPGSTRSTDRASARPMNASYGSATQLQRDIVEAAYDLVGSRRLMVDGERFPADCTGAVLAAYYAAGLDLREHFSDFTGNGVTRLHKIGEHYSLMNPASRPQPGDIVFWDNTYDRNGDGRFNDSLTHAGVVVDVQPNGQLEYVHYNYARGVVVEKLNLNRPDAHRDGNTLVNSPMRLRSDRHIKPDSWLASHLFRSFAGLHRLAQ